MLNKYIITLSSIIGFFRKKNNEIVIIKLIKPSKINNKKGFIKLISNKYFSIVSNNALPIQEKNVKPNDIILLLH